MYNDPEMLEIFEALVIKSTEILDNLSQDLVVQESNPDDSELLNRIFRAFHTIKSTSYFMGFEKLSNLTHLADDILNKLRKFELKFNKDVVDTLLKVDDSLVLMLDKIKSGEDLSSIDYTSILKKIETLKEGGSFVDIPIVTTFEKFETTTEKHAPETKRAVQKVLEVSNEILSKHGNSTPKVFALIDAAFEEVNKSIIKDSSISEKFSKTTQQPELSLIQSKQETNHISTQNTSANQMLGEPFESFKSSELVQKVVDKTSKDTKVKVATTETIRMDVSRVEHLMNLSGELFLGRNRLEQITKTFLIGDVSKETLKELEDTTSSIDFIISEIQASIMRMRMVPIGKLFQKAPRIARDLSKQFNKLVDYGEGRNKN